MKSLPDCLEDLALRPMGVAGQEPCCRSCGSPEFGLVDGLCIACERDLGAGARTAEWIAAARANRAGTLAGLGVPPKYCEPFEEPVRWPRDSKVALDVAVWQGAPWSLFLTGNTGVGKSFLAAELLWRNHLRASQVRSGLFVRASRVPALVFGRDAASDFDPLRLVQVEILVIDELGLGHPRGGWEALDDVIAQRWERQCPTIVTSRWTLAQVASEAVSAADRLAEGLVARVEGRSRRRPPAAVTEPSEAADGRKAEGSLDERK